MFSILSLRPNYGLSKYCACVPPIYVIRSVCIVVFMVLCVRQPLAGENLNGSGKINTAQAEARTEIIQKHFDKDRIRLLYSENDSICIPLAELYAKLNHDEAKNPPNHLSTTWIWEEAYATKFSAIGLLMPPRTEMKRSQNQNGEISAIYNVFIPELARYYKIYLDDTPFGAASVSTNIYVLNNISDKFGDSHPHVEDFQDAVQFAVLFGRGGKGANFPNIHLPYEFTKNNVQSRFRFINSITAETAILSNRAPGLIKNAPIIQRLWMYNGKIFITARQAGLGNSALVYTLTSDAAINDVCYFASNVAEIGR